MSTNLGPGDSRKLGGKSWVFEKIAFLGSGKTGERGKIFVKMAQKETWYDLAAAGNTVLGGGIHRYPAANAEVDCGFVVTVRNCSL